MTSHAWPLSWKKKTTPSAMLFVTWSWRSRLAFTLNPAWCCPMYFELLNFQTFRRPVPPHTHTHQWDYWSSLLSLCSPEVTFCGYSVPHPSERKINFRIQTNGESCWTAAYHNYQCSDWPGVPAVDALRKGLDDLHELCDHVLHTFQVQCGLYGGNGFTLLSYPIWNWKPFSSSLSSLKFLAIESVVKFLSTI